MATKFYIFRIVQCILLAAITNSIVESYPNNGTQNQTYTSSLLTSFLDGSYKNVTEADDVISSQGQNQEKNESNLFDNTNNHKMIKRASGSEPNCLRYGADCSGGYCCHHLGLHCVTNSEGRGRNHNFCRYLY